MSQIEMLRLLITQRLTAAAEEIFGVFGRTIAEYEDEISRSKMEISRQRRLLELSRKPQVCLQDEEEEEEGGSSAQEPRSWSPALRDMEAPPIKKEEEEEEELWSARQEERSQEFLFFQSGGVRSEPDDDERHRERTTSPLATLQDPEDSEPGPLPGPSLQQTCSAEDASGPVFGDGRPDAAASSYICTVCGRAFTQRSLWAKHVQVHRATDPRVDKSYTCDICGKRLTRFDGYQKHLRIHTGEKPYTCGACGRRFSDNSNYKRHIRTHAGPKTPS